MQTYNKCCIKSNTNSIFLILQPTVSFVWVFERIHTCFFSSTFVLYCKATRLGQQLTLSSMTISLTTSYEGRAICFFGMKGSLDLSTPICYMQYSKKHSLETHSEQQLWKSETNIYCHRKLLQI